MTSSVRLAVFADKAPLSDRATTWGFAPILGFQGMKWDKESAAIMICSAVTVCAFCRAATLRAKCAMRFTFLGRPLVA